MHHDVYMRTTLTLDNDVAALIDDAVHVQRRPIKEVINEALRRGLAPTGRDAEPYRLVPHDSAVRAGIDPAGLNRLAGELADEQTVASLKGAS